MALQIRPAKDKLSTAQQKLVKALREGLRRPQACIMAGLHPDTFQKWLERGQVDEKDQPVRPEWQKYVEFRQAIEQAEVEHERDLLVKKTKADPGWYLERAYSERYGLQQKIQIEVRGAIGEFLEVLKERASAATFAEVCAICADFLKPGRGMAQKSRTEATDPGEGEPSS